MHVALVWYEDIFLNEYRISYYISEATVWCMIENITDESACNVRERVKGRKYIFHCAVGVFCTNISTIDKLCLMNHEKNWKKTYVFVCYIWTNRFAIVLYGAVLTSFKCNKMCINKLHQVCKMFARIVLRVFTICFKQTIDDEVVQDEICPHCIELERGITNKCKHKYDCCIF